MAESAFGVTWRDDQSYVANGVDGTSGGLCAIPRLRVTRV